MTDYKDDNVWLMKGDCLERMKEIPDGSVDMILADPPYQITKCKWDSIIPLEPMWEQLKRIIKPNGAIVMTASQPFTSILVCSNLKMFKYEWVWEKSHPSLVALAKKRVMKYHESVLVFYSNQPNYYPIMTKGAPSHSQGNQIGSSNGSESNPSFTQKDVVYGENKHPKSVIKVANPRIKGQHPTQKPVALMEYLIKTYTNEDETVLDFTMGSGTTGVACVNTNRKFIGIEMDEGYFNTAKNRILKEGNLND